MQLALWIIEVYVNYFIVMAQNPSRALLRHISRAVIISIHEVFVPTHISGHNRGGSVAIKNFIEGKGAWSIEKYIFGWYFNGITFCIFLSTCKRQKLIKSIKEALHIKSLSRNKFQNLWYGCNIVLFASQPEKVYYNRSTRPYKKSLAPSTPDRPLTWHSNYNIG